MRTKINDGWLFLKGDLEGFRQAEEGDGSWQPVKLPHDWSIDGPFSPKNYIPEIRVAKHIEGRGDSYLPKGIGWYKKKLQLEKEEGCTVYIEFEGVFRNSTLWVNGSQAGSHPWGYTGFVYDITEFLSPAGREDILLMRVDASRMEGWWYEGSGIYRNVWLISKPALHVSPWGVHISTPDVSDVNAKVHIKLELTNNSDLNHDCRVVSEIISPSGEVAVSVETALLLQRKSGASLVQECALQNPHLWSIEEPNLYTARTRILREGRETDSVDTSFGLRWFEFTPDRGFFLNGKHVQIRGGNIHHDFGGLGCALPDRANEKTVEVLKEMGCTMVRSAHNAAAPSLMDACDRLGLLFWAEHRYLGPVGECGQPLREMIRRDRNHPSIVLWGLANTAGSPDGVLTGYLKELNAIVRQECTERPTVVGLEGNDGANDNGFAFVSDVVGYNGGGMGIDDRDHRLYPERRMLISEYSSGRGARGIYSVEKAEEGVLEEFGDGRIMRRAGSYSTIFSLCESHEKEWSHIDVRPWLAGGLMWSAIEYRGETSGWPVVTSQFGVIDICRFPKDTFYYYKKMWTDQPVLHIFPHWTWPGREGQLIDLWCYTNCDNVDIYLNGRLQKGIPVFLQKGSSFPHFYWTLLYEPGTVTAEASLNGKIVCRQEICTAGKAVRLAVSADRQELSADNEDISFITVRVEDEGGTVVPVASNRIEASVRGSGRLLGLCSGDPASHENPKGRYMKAFNGLCLAIVQSTKSRGKIDVEFKSPGMSDAAISLYTK